MTRSIDSSSVTSVICLPPVRAVSSAASFTTLARSAPVNPGVRRAITCRSTPGSIGLPLACTSRICLRPCHVGTVDGDLAVEATRAQQGGVEDVRPVGGGDHDDAALDVEAVHLDQHLVEGLLALVVTATEPGAAVPADGVDLVDEDDRRGVGLGLLEQVADARGADTDEHLDEVGTGDRVERHAGLAGDSAGQQGLAGAGRPVEQHALGDLGAHGLELARALEELLDLLELLDRLVDAGDVGERRLGGVLADQLGLGLAELHDARAAALHLGHEVEQQAEDDQEGQERHQDRHQQALLADRDVVPGLGGLEGRREVTALVDQEGRLELLALLAVLALELRRGRPAPCRAACWSSGRRPRPRQRCAPARSTSGSWS